MLWLGFLLHLNAFAAEVSPARDCRHELTQVFGEQPFYFRYRARLLLRQEQTDRLLGRGYEIGDLLNDTALDLLGRSNFDDGNESVENTARLRGYVAAVMRNRLHEKLNEKPALKLQPGTLCGMLFDTERCFRTELSETVWEDYSIVPPELEATQSLWETALGKLGEELAECSSKYGYDLADFLESLGPSPYSELAKALERKWQEFRREKPTFTQHSAFALSLAKVVSRSLSDSFMGYAPLKQLAFARLRQKVRSAKYPVYYDQAFIQGLPTSEIAERDSISPQAVKRRNRDAEAAVLESLRFFAAQPPENG